MEPVVTFTAPELRKLPLNSVCPVPTDLVIVPVLMNAGVPAVMFIRSSPWMAVAPWLVQVELPTSRSPLSQAMGPWVFRMSWLTPPKLPPARTMGPVMLTVGWGWPPPGPDMFAAPQLTPPPIVPPVLTIRLPWMLRVVPSSVVTVRQLPESTTTVLFIPSGAISTSSPRVGLAPGPEQVAICQLLLKVLVALGQKMV